MDTRQFTTLIGARTPPSACPEHGVKTMQVPRVAPQGRFTLWFKRWAVEVRLASASVSQACGRLGIGWDSAQEIRRREAQRGLERRSWDRLNYLGMDEKSIRRGAG